jgi:hypothetical protein
MNNVFKTMMTGKDNHSHDIAKWTWLGGFAIISIVAVYLIYNGHQISLMELAGALGANSGLNAAAVAGKQLSGAEPDPQ